MEGKFEGAPSGSRQCFWLKIIREFTGLDSHTLLIKAHKRTEFATVLADLH